MNKWRHKRKPAVIDWGVVGWGWGTRTVIDYRYTSYLQLRVLYICVIVIEAFYTGSFLFFCWIL